MNLSNDSRPVGSAGERPAADLPTLVLHWLLVAALLLSLLTGLRIAWDYSDSVAGAVARLVPWLLPQGRVIELHVWSGWLLTLVTVAYALLLWRARLGVRVRVDAPTRRSIAQAWRAGSLWASTTAWFALNRVMFQVAFLLMLVMAVTGWLMYAGLYPRQARALQTVHGLAAWSFLIYVALHVLASVRAGRFRVMFRLRAQHLAAGALAAGIALALVSAAWVADRNLHATLSITRVGSGPPLDGSGDNALWQQTGSVVVRTVRGANLPGGLSDVEIRAVHDGEHVWFRFRWEDPQRSQKHLPLIRREDGWHVLQTGYDTNDVNDYYEDKFAAILSTRPDLASGTTHLGQDVIEGPHYRNPRGLHFTTDGSIVDLWHWKSVRSGGMEPAYVDDNHIGPPLPSVEEGARYTGGYTQDPQAPEDADRGHPYMLNWRKVDPDLSLDRTAVVPRYLPADPAILDRMGDFDLDPSAGDEGIWHMQIEEAVPYDEALDDYPVGTVLPGVVIDGTFSGDRADVRAEAQWRDGHWTLEVRRALDTGSQYDVAFVPERPVYIWVAVFNHTQTRHSQHLHPVRLVLE